MAKVYKADQSIFTPSQEKEMARDGRKPCQSSYHEGDRLLPANSKHFYRNGARWDGWATVCKVCWAKQKADADSRMKDDEEKGALASFVRLARTRKSVPHMTEMIEAVITRLDGVEGLADLFVNDLLAANPGSPHRLRAAEAVMHMVVKNTEMGHAQKPMELYTDEELAEYLAANTKVIQDGKAKLLEAPFEDEEDEDESDED